MVWVILTKDGMQRALAILICATILVSVPNLNRLVSAPTGTEVRVKSVKALGLSFKVTYPTVAIYLRSGGESSSNVGCMKAEGEVNLRSRGPAGGRSSATNYGVKYRVTPALQEDGGLDRRLGSQDYLYSGGANNALRAHLRCFMGKPVGQAIKPSVCLCAKYTHQAPMSPLSFFSLESEILSGTPFSERSGDNMREGGEKIKRVELGLSNPEIADPVQALHGRYRSIDPFLHHPFSLETSASISCCLAGLRLAKWSFAVMPTSIQSVVQKDSGFPVRPDKPSIKVEILFWLISVVNPLGIALAFLASIPKNAGETGFKSTEHLISPTEGNTPISVRSDFLVALLYVLFPYAPFLGHKKVHTIPLV